jgi:parvulin-like peptidyl-prolyl isomerase
LIDKLRDRIAADRVDEYFCQHTHDFDKVRIARIEVTDESQAGNLAEQISDGTQDFFTIAERSFQEAADKGATLPAELFAVIERRQVAPAVGDRLFAASPGQLVGPVKTERGYSLFRVLSFNPARLDDRTVTTIKNILFEEWLAERRQAAQIEWCWGNASKTG